MIEKHKTIMVAWEFAFSLVIMYNMITVPLYICFPWIVEKTTTKEKVVDYTVELLWVL
jgi:hypothetical protein